MQRSDEKQVDQTIFLDEKAQTFVASMGEVLAKQDDLDAALSQVLNSLTAFLAAEALSVFLVDESSGDLVLKYATGKVRAEVVGLVLKSGQGIVGWVVKHSEDLIVPYPGLDARFFDEVDSHTGFSTRSILCSPLRVDGHAIGAIEVLNKIEGTFNDDDLVLLRAVARLVAGVITTATV